MAAAGAAGEAGTEPEVSAAEAGKAAAGKAAEA